MLPKPAHLTPENSERFKNVNVASVYKFRAPYPPETFTILSELITDQPRIVLDVGAGTGDIARHLVKLMERVDAVDFSEAMLAQGKQLVGAEKVNWIHGPVEAAALQPPYALITAGESLHWMDWSVVLPRFKQMLTPHGVLAMIERGELPVPWHDEMHQLIREFSSIPNFEPYNLSDELQKRGLFQKSGKKKTSPVVVSRSVEDYVASFHSASSLSRDHMSAEAVAAFDAQLKDLVQPWLTNNQVALQVYAEIVWGKPK